MSHLPPAHHETSKRDSPNETKIKEKYNKTVPDSNSNLAKSMTHHNQTKELTTWFLRTTALKLTFHQPLSLSLFAISFFFLATRTFFLSNKIFLNSRNFFCSFFLSLFWQQHNDLVQKTLKQNDPQIYRIFRTARSTNMGQILGGSGDDQLRK
jgi:hypothetical protein